MKHFFSYLEDSFKKFRNEPALSNFDGSCDYSYGEVAEKIARLHLLFKAVGIKKGDKIAFCGKNSSNLAVHFLAATTYEATAVTILADFSADSIHKLVNHSEARLLFVGQQVYSKLSLDEMPNIDGIAGVEEFAVLSSRSALLSESYSNIEELFAKEYPNGFDLNSISYPKDNLNDIAIINYTSGTTGNPKGVMVSYRSISSNVCYGQDNIANRPGWSVVAMLPMAHMFGLTFELLYQLAGGCHVYYLNRTPTPQILTNALQTVKPYMILTVPLVIEKIFKKNIFPLIEKTSVKILWYTPIVGNIIRKKVANKLLQSFGGEIRYLIIGGAALNKKVEKSLRQIKFPYTVGYGMTECGPIVSYAHWKQFKKYSCGRLADRMEIKIDKPNAEGVGEILIKGDNLMSGYYKNEEATNAIFTKDGWMHTGDLGIVDKESNIYLRGRNKNMILGPSGQNIYPEEIEERLNNMPHILESLVLDRQGKLTALVYVDEQSLREDESMRGASIPEFLEHIKVRVNSLLPSFSKIVIAEKVDREFEKTPKCSIKRFLYK